MILQVTLKRFEESLKATERSLAEVLSDLKALAGEKLALEQALHKAAEELKVKSKPADACHTPWSNLTAAKDNISLPRLH